MPGRATATSGGDPAANCWVSRAWVWSNGTCSTFTLTWGFFCWKASITAWKASPSEPVQFDTTRSWPDAWPEGAGVCLPLSFPHAPAARAREATMASPVRRRRCA
jgi:hypothetical protein